MAAIGLILVVAPDHEFRRSLEFTLEAELYGVDSHDGLTTAVASPLTQKALCAIVDEDAVRDHALGWEALDHLPTPVILLLDKLKPPVSRPDMTVLAKPLLGRALIQAVRSIAGDPMIH